MLSGPASCTVDLLNGRIVAGGVEPRLSPLERSLPVFLGLNPGGATREEIARTFYVHANVGAFSAIKVLVYRIRRKLGNSACILFARGGYALDHDPTAELRALERDVAAAAACKGPLDEAARERLEGYRARLREQRPVVLLDQEWFERLERQLRHLERAVSVRLADDAHARRDFPVALDLVSDLIAADPLDEEACEVMIRVQLALGKRGAALAEYRRYDDVLQRELGASAPARLRELLFP